MQRLSLMGLLVALIAAVALMPSLAMGAACPSTDTSSTGNCGSTFAVPAWSDTGGWTDPSQYSTIRLADVNGDGRDELLGRSSDGIEVHEFDTSLGQWRPQVDAKGIRQLVSWITVTQRVPLKARGRFCADVVTTAPNTRAVSDKVCSTVAG